MIRRRTVETFNTHRLSAEVIRALATGRDQELDEVMAAIRDAASQPDRPPQHLIVYGERGSGKSFLLRLTELTVEEEIAETSAQVVFALLPEEHYNIRTPPQLLEAVAAKIRGDNWSESAYSFDKRTPEKAWNEARQALNSALDRRFGVGQGLAVAAIENFDQISKSLFGSQPSEKSKTKKAQDQRKAEERLRHMMTAPGERFMLLGTATGTVDLDYERPLFQAFKSIDLSIWDAEACVEYFNRRRRLDHAAELTTEEAARARAISEFIGGNPRLAQLLGDVLNSPEARTIAETLDALSDHLADYYRRRMDDLPPNAAGLLDALIRGGEPKSQTELADYVGARQNQIADAFSYLLTSRLLAEHRERDGHRSLYRVRDRLFVHFYRRRYGFGYDGEGLAPIADLLATFFTSAEKIELAKRHLAAGELAEAKLFLDLRRMDNDEEEHESVYNYAAVMGSRLLGHIRLAGLESDNLAARHDELKHNKTAALVYWKDVSATGQTPIQRAVAAILYSRAASRCNLDDDVKPTLNAALEEVNADDDAKCLLLCELGAFVLHQDGDETAAIAWFQEAARLAESVSLDAVRLEALIACGFSAASAGDHEKALAMLDRAASLADTIEMQADIYLDQVLNLMRLDLPQDVVAVTDRLKGLMDQGGSAVQWEAILYSRGSCLDALGRHEEAVATFEEANTRIKRLLDSVQGHGDEAHEFSLHKLRANALLRQGDLLRKLGRHEEAVAVLEEAEAFAEKSGDAYTRCQSLFERSNSLHELGRDEEALAVLDEAILLSDTSRHLESKTRALIKKGRILWKLQNLENSLYHLHKASEIAGSIGANNLKFDAELEKVLVFWFLNRLDDSIELSKALIDQSNKPYLLSLKADIEVHAGRLKDAVEDAQAAVTLAEEQNRLDELQHTRQVAILVAARTSVPGISAHVQSLVETAKSETLMERLTLNEILAAIARADEWGEMKAIMAGREDWFGQVKSTPAFDRVGRVWAEMVATQGRAETFGMVANRLPVVTEVMGRLAEACDPKAPQPLRRRYFRELIDGLVAVCDDPGFLGDLADLIEHDFAEDAVRDAARLRIFARFHAAEDKEAVLQRIDPDLAIAIRRIWDVPEPEDQLARKGRRKGR